MELKLPFMVLALLFLSFSAAQAAPSQHSNTNNQSQSKQSSSQSHNSQGQHVQVKGTKIYYRVSGQGVPLLLVHGYPLNSDMFKHQRQSLSKHFKVITPDLPGFGKSGTLDKKANLDAYAQTLFNLMDKLDIKKAIMGGQGLGGMTVMQMYKDHPDRFRGLILIDTAIAAASSQQQKMWYSYAELPQKNSDNYMQILQKKLIPQLLSESTRKHNKQLKQEVEHMIKAASKQGVTAGGKALAKRPDNTEMLHQIDVPTLIIVGSQDKITPVSTAKNMHESIEDSKLKIIRGASHLAVMEKPQAVDQVINQLFGKMQEHHHSERRNS